MKMIANHATNMITIKCKEIHGTYNTCLDPLACCKIWSLESFLEWSLESFLESILIQNCWYMKNMLLEKNWDKKGGCKKVTCPQVPVFCYMHTTIAYRNSVRNGVTIKKNISVICLCNNSHRSLTGRPWPVYYNIFLCFVC